MPTLQQIIVSQIDKFWRSNVIKPLMTVSDPIEYNRTLMEINQSLYTELYGIMQNRLYRGFKRGLVEGSTAKISEAEIIEKFRPIFEQTHIVDSIRKLSERLYTRLAKIPSLISEIESRGLSVEGAMLSIANSELQKYETVARSDNHFVRNNGRAIEFERRDLQQRFRYRWGIGRDARVTECCKEIEETVNSESAATKQKGVTLKRLEIIVAFTGNKYFPEYIQRKFDPHWNCRSGVEKIT